MREDKNFTLSNDMRASYNDGSSLRRVRTRADQCEKNRTEQVSASSRVLFTRTRLTGAANVSLYMSFELLTCVPDGRGDTMQCKYLVIKSSQIYFVLHSRSCK